MMGLFVMEFFLVTAYLMSLLTLVFNALTPLEMWGVWAYTFGVSLVTVPRIHKQPLFLLLLFAPLLWFKSSLAGVVIFLYAGGISAYGVVRENHLLDYKHLVIAGYGVLGLFFAGWLGLDALFSEVFDQRFKSASSLIIAFVMMSFLFLRTYRHSESQLSTKELRKSNLAIGGLMATTFVLAHFDEVRTQLFEAVRTGTQSVVHFLLKPVYAIFSDFGLEENPFETLEEISSDTQTLQTFGESAGEATQTAQEAAVNWALLLFKIGLWVIITSLGAFILYKVYKMFRFKSAREKATDDGVTVKKTFIKREKKPKKGRLPLFRQTPTAKIRRLYRVHMASMTLDRRLDTTSEDVARQGEREGFEAADAVKTSYRLARYSAEPVSKSMAEAFKKLIK